MHNKNELDLIQQHMSKSARENFWTADADGEGSEQSKGVGMYIVVGSVAALAVLGVITVVSFLALMPPELAAIM